MTWLQKLLAPIRKAADIAFNSVSVAWYARNGYDGLYRLLGGGDPSWSGMSVSESTALNCSTVWACVRVISDAVASLPLRLYRRSGPNGEDRVRATDHPLYSLLSELPNPDQTSLDWRSASHAHLMMWGNCFSQIIRSSDGRIIELAPITPDRIAYDFDEYGRMVYKVANIKGAVETWDSSKIFHVRGLGFDGRWGYSVISHARNTIGLAMSQEKYGAKFFSSGGRVPYVLEHPGNWKNDEAAKQFRETWEAAYGGENWHKGVILTGGMKYAQIGLKPEDAQFLASRQFQVPDICRWFRVSPHLVGDLSRATFSNIEHLGIEFYTQTLYYWLRAWEQAITRCLLTKEERKTYYAEFDTSAILRGDYKTRMEGYSIGRQNGWLSANDIRRMENMNPIDGGDVYTIQLNMQPLVGLEERTNETLEESTEPEEPREETRGVVAINNENVLLLPQPQAIQLSVAPRPRGTVTKKFLRDETGRISGIEEMEDGFQTISTRG